MGMDRITDPAVIAAVLAYCRAHYQYCSAVHTPPESTIGGFSCILIGIDGDRAVIELANGDRHTVPIAEVSLSAS